MTTGSPASLAGESEKHLLLSPVVVAVLAGVPRTIAAAPEATLVAVALDATLVHATVEGGLEVVLAVATLREAVTVTDLRTTTVVAPMAVTVRMRIYTAKRERVVPLAQTTTQPGAVKATAVAANAPTVGTVDVRLVTSRTAIATKSVGLTEMAISVRKDAVAQDPTVLETGVPAMDIVVATQEAPATAEAHRLVLTAPVAQRATDRKVHATAAQTDLAAAAPTPPAMAIVPTVDIVAQVATAAAANDAAASPFVKQRTWGPGNRVSLR